MASATSSISPCRKCRTTTCTASAERAGPAPRAPRSALPARTTPSPCRRSRSCWAARSTARCRPRSCSGRFPASPSPDPHRRREKEFAMTLRITTQDLSRAVDSGVLQPGQDRALLDFLQTRTAQRPSFQLAHVVFYFGALLVMAALGWLITEAWMQVGDGALLALALIYMGVAGFLGLLLWKRGHEIPGGLLSAVAVSLTPLVVFAV